MKPGEDWETFRNRMAEGVGKEQEWDQCLNFLKQSGLTVDEIYAAIRKVKVKEQHELSPAVDPRQMELPGVQHFNGA